MGESKHHRDPRAPLVSIQHTRNFLSAPCTTFACRRVFAIGENEKANANETRLEREFKAAETGKEFAAGQFCLRADFATCAISTADEAFPARIRGK